MINYIYGTVKILEKPRKKLSSQNISVTKIRAQFPQARSNDSQKFVRLIFWGELNEGILKYYKPNDYLIIEGYISLKTESKLQTKALFASYPEITILKVYPFFLNLNYQVAD